MLSEVASVAYWLSQRLEAKRPTLPVVHFHDLRHTCAALLLSRGYNGTFVQELLGHATIVITLDTYSHALPGVADHTTTIEDVLCTNCR